MKPRLAAGRSVATDVPGCRELVIDGHTGLLVPPADAAALADAVLRLLHDDVLRDRLGSAARALVEERFSDQCIVAQTFAVYDAQADA